MCIISILMYVPLQHKLPPKKDTEKSMTNVEMGWFIIMTMQSLCEQSLEIP